MNIFHIIIIITIIISLATFLVIMLLRRGIGSALGFAFTMLFAGSAIYGLVYALRDQLGIPKEV